MNVISGSFNTLIFASGNITNSVIFRPEFVPTDFPNLLSWYSSDYGIYNAPGVLASEGQTVQTWQNKLNNGFNLLHDNINYQPKYISGAITFSGNNALTGINTSALNYPINYYVATQTILSGNDSTWAATIIKQGRTATVNNMRYIFTVNTGSKLGVRDINTQTISNITMSNGKNIIYAIFSGSNTEILGKGNSSEVLNATMNTNSISTFTVGALGGIIPVYPLFGSIYEILVYTGSAHTESERSQIINYLSNKWGVSI